MKRFLFILGFLVSLQAANTQALNAISIEDCYKLAKQNYPLIKRQALITKAGSIPLPTFQPPFFRNLP